MNNLLFLQGIPIFFVSVNCCRHRLLFYFNFRTKKNSIILKYVYFLFFFCVFINKNNQSDWNRYYSYFLINILYIHTCVCCNKV